MRPKSMVLILIALACGLVASIGISQVVDKKSTEQETAQMAPVYVAAADIPIHERLTAQTVRREDWPIERIPPGAVTNLEDIDGRKPSQPLYKGEVILGARLVDPNSRVMTSERIPKGYRVVSVKVSMDSAVSGLLSPGDRVDIIGYFKGKGRTPTTKTVLTDVTVFAINNQISRATGEETDRSINAKTVSLTVTPSQAQRLLLAAELGQIKLSLRHIEDDSNETPDKTEIDDLTPGGKTNIFGEALHHVKLPVAESLPAGGGGHKMEIISPTSKQEYVWTDPNVLPELVSRQDDPIVPSLSAPQLPASAPPAPPTTPPAGNETETDAGFDFDSLTELGAD